MKLAEVLSLIEDHERISSKKGFLVWFTAGSYANCFPDIDTEELIQTEEEAINLGERFINAYGGKGQFKAVKVLDQDDNVIKVLL